MFHIDEKITLSSFLGTGTPIEKVSTEENYWLLIGQTGTIIDMKGKKVLIKFDCDINSYGLQCHNPIENSLWIDFYDIAKMRAVVRDG